MASLADIWNTPAESASHSDAAPTHVNYDDDDDLGSNTKRSITRPQSTLFLDSDSENDVPKSSKAHYASKPGASKPDIDAFWDDLDEEPETAFKPLAPSLDVEALKRQADAKIALTPHQILPSSSPPRDLGDDEAGGKEKGGRKGKEVTTKKKKRARLDEGRLVGPSGFPALVKHAKDFKPKGKGHELSDLNRLLNVYQFWGHQMYPNTQFKDTVQRVEKLCHSKRLHVALSVWRDEAKGLINGQNNFDPGDPDHSDSDSDDNDKNDHDHDDAARPSDVPIATEDERSSPAPSRGPSLPPSSASDTGGPDDNFDIDAMIAEEEAARAQEAASGPVRPTSESRPPMDEDEAMWDEMMGDSLPDQPWIPSDPEATAGSSKPVATKPTMDEDEDMWDALGDFAVDASETTTSASTTAGATTTSATAFPPGPGNAERGSSPVTGAAGLVGLDPTRPATNDDGWDEMYA
ncbi:replication fork protection component Swi3-domain-containing protein [Daedaleopsis nitida]|nr:replication fork protection component Swi3-domain-containing protein [Daedaleopsis nitida]